MYRTRESQGIQFPQPYHTAARACWRLYPPMLGFFNYRPFFNLGLVPEQYLVFYSLQVVGRHTCTVQLIARL
jgi:hypothetical protein